MTNNLNIRTVVVGAFQVNCFVVWKEPPEALVIDPGEDAEAVAAVLKQENLTVAAYLLTHGHMDHVSGLADLYDLFPAPVAMHAEDLEWAFTEHNQMMPYGTPRRPPEVARTLADGQEWTDAGLTYRVIGTPGHTTGGVSFYFPEEKVVFAGDTLFAGSVGRTDFSGGSSRMLGESLKKLANFPDDTVVYCGHGPQTTIGHEKRTNYFMQGGF